MNSTPDTATGGVHPVIVTRVADTEWHALADGEPVGSANALHRSDGRMFLSIDAWDDAVFDRLAAAVPADLPGPLWTVVDEADTDLRSRWERAGFTTARREWEYVLPTEPGGAVRPTPPELTLLPLGSAEEAPLRALDRAIRDEVEAAVGWWTMPAEILVRPGGDTVLDPSKYAVAVRDGRYVGLARVVQLRRQARIGLIAVRADQQRKGIGRALLAQVLGALHRAGTGSAWAEVHEANAAATALFEGAGGRRRSSNLELVRH
jgi:ribosomal protein S18 acetylase RimI-like enzyme